MQFFVKMATKRRRTDLTLGQKLEIVSALERERVSQAELAKRFSCAQSTISKIAKSKDAILKEAEENKSATRKRKRASKDKMSIPRSIPGSLTLEHETLPLFVYTVIL